MADKTFNITNVSGGRVVAAGETMVNNEVNDVRLRTVIELKNASKEIASLYEAGSITIEFPNYTTAMTVVEQQLLQNLKEKNSTCDTN